MANGPTRDSQSAPPSSSLQETRTLPTPKTSPALRRKVQSGNQRNPLFKAALQIPEPIVCNRNGAGLL